MGVWFRMAKLSAGTIQHSHIFCPDFCKRMENYARLDFLPHLTV